jgi:hypothetical protein
VSNHVPVVASQYDDGFSAAYGSGHEGMDTFSMLHGTGCHHVGLPVGPGHGLPERSPRNSIPMQEPTPRGEPTGGPPKWAGGASARGGITEEHGQGYAPIPRLRARGAGTLP